MPFDLDARLADWRKSLLDTSKRNRLIKFAAGRVGGVNLLHPPPAGLWARLVRDGGSVTFPWRRDLLNLKPEILDAETLAADFDPTHGTAEPDAADVAREWVTLCARSPRLRPEHVLTDFADGPLAARLTRLFRTAKEAATDHGVTTLFAAFGFLRWFESPDSDEELLSPLLLVPVRLGRETVESEFTLRAEEDEILPNHCLAELLQTQFRIKLPTAAECPLDPENPECLANYLAAVGAKVSHVPRWGVAEAAALGVFNFQKLAMWEDLGRNVDRVKAHPLCRAVAGDRAALPPPPADLPLAPDLDRVVPPERAVHILDADSSQQEAIEAVKRGAHLVMDGPPGTGKSQTIANMIAEALSAGKTVLFVSEKTAALDVVKRRLDKCGLGDFCLELHSHKASKKEVVAELGRCLDLALAGVPDTAERLKELAEARRKLNEFVAELHAVRPPLGWSAFRVHGELSRLGGVPGRSRLVIPDVFARDAEYVRRGSEILAGLADSRAVLEDVGGHPWRGCKVTAYTHAAADEAKFNLTRLANAVPAAVKAAGELTAAGLCDAPTNRAWARAEADARRVLPLPLFPAAWFRADARTAAEAAVELDTASHTARDLAGRLPEFDPKAVRGMPLPPHPVLDKVEHRPPPQGGRSVNTSPLEGEVAAEQREEAGGGGTQGVPAVRVDIALSPDRERLVAGAMLTARKRLDALAAIGTALRKAAEQARAVETAGGEVVARLRIPVHPPLGQLGELAALAERIAKAPPIPESWWNPTRRTELVAVFTRAADDERAAQELRTRLVAKFTPAAFATEAAGTAWEAARFAASFWRWLPWSDWRRLRKQVGAWYAGGPPDTATLRADVAELAKYHRHADAHRQVATAYPGEHFPSPAGPPDWAATLAALRDIDRLSMWYPPLGSGPDREKLRPAAETLGRATAAFQEDWSALLRDFAVPDSAGVPAKSPADVAAWLDAETVAVGAEAAALGRVVALLSPGKDVAAGNIRQRVTDLCHLIEARGRIATAARTLNDARSPEALEAADHSGDADLAGSLLAFLTEWGKPVPPALAATLTDAAARGRLKAAVQASEAAHREFAKPWDVIAADLFDVEARVSTDVVPTDLPLADLKTWAAARAADADRLAEWARFVQVEHDAAAFDITPVLDEVKAGEFPAASAADAFRARFYRLWLDALHHQVPALAQFATDTHERLAARFAELDRLAIRTTADRVRGQLLANPQRVRSRGGAPESSELGVLLREANKKRRHLPLRHLFRQIPAVLPRLKPCLMMSPLAVSTYLDSPDIAFDLVIFDEASQVRPHDAVCALYRGRQLVVGGDPKQLPPTDFFTRTAEDGEEAESDSGFESLLDVCLSLGLTRKRLRWHYRSRREGLIAFSNRFFYDGRLVTFPSADEAATRAVTFVKVPDGRFADGVNVVEAKRVAALVMDHARNTPDRSLGVIAFSQRQQDRILDELEMLRRQHPDLEPFFDDGRDDPFFVKNLENVQGDERDVIFLSVGYGPDETGKVMMRFGPLNRAGGERRLNVAVTRARWAMTVVASMTAADVDLSRTGAEGAKLLKAFLDYAERGPAALAEAITEAESRGADSPFEQEVGDELARRGLAVHRQVGCGGYRIDLAIADPQQGGRYLLGVECDGATYHAAATARDRDRLRQAVLEGLGWRLVRVWSSDWVRDRDKQVRRVLAALDAAKQPMPAAPGPERVPVLKPLAAKQKVVDYADIETVPEPALSDAITGALTDFGSMPAEDLIAAVAKRLGFKRTGPKIRERTAATLNALVAAGTVAVEGDDGRVRLVPRLSPSPLAGEGGS